MGAAPAPRARAAPGKAERGGSPTGRRVGDRHCARGGAHPLSSCGGFGSGFPPRCPGTARRSLTTFRGPSGWATPGWSGRPSAGSLPLRRGTIPSTRSWRRSHRRSSLAARSWSAKQAGAVQRVYPCGGRRPDRISAGGFQIWCPVTRQMSPSLRCFRTLLRVPSAACLASTCSRPFGVTLTGSLPSPRGSWREALLLPGYRQILYGCTVEYYPVFEAWPLPSML
jgi:hypothetical protein